MKKLISWIVTLLVFITSNIAIASEPQYLKLADAQLIAADHSIQLELAKLELLEAEHNFKQATGAMIMQPSPVLQLQAQAGLDLARLNYLLAVDRLKLQVQQDFYNVLKMENLVEIAQEALESAKRRLDITEKKFEAGTVTRLEVIKATANVLNAEASLAQSRHGLELAYMKFRQTLGMPLEGEIYVASEAFDIEYITVDLEADLKFALENRQEVQQLEKAIAIAKKDVELADNSYTPAVVLQQAKINLAKLETQLEQVKQLLALDIRQNYSAMENAAARIKVYQKEVEEASEMLHLAELSFEADLITGNELADAQLGLLSAKNNLVAAIYDYNLAKAGYANAVADALRE